MGGGDFGPDPRSSGGVEVGGANPGYVDPLSSRLTPVRAGVGTPEESRVPLRPPQTPLTLTVRHPTPPGVPAAPQGEQRRSWLLKRRKGGRETGPTAAPPQTGGGGGEVPGARCAVGTGDWRGRGSRARSGDVSPLPWGLRRPSDPQERREGGSKEQGPRGRGRTPGATGSRAHQRRGRKRLKGWRGRDTQADGPRGGDDKPATLLSLDPTKRVRPPGPFLSRDPIQTTHIGATLFHPTPFRDRVGLREASLKLLKVNSHWK